MSFLAILMITAAVNASGNYDHCTIPVSVVTAFDSPSTVKHEDFVRAERHVTAVCPSGLVGISRERYFHVIERHFTLPYRDMYARWQRQEGYVSSEVDADWAAVVDVSMLDELDRITTPADIRYKDIILKWARGKAIAQLGPAVLNDVSAIAATPAQSVFANSRYRNAQAEALRAIGYWLDRPGDLTPDQQHDITQVALAALPPIEPGTRSGYDVASAAVEALEHSADPVVAQRLADWAAMLPSNSALKSPALRAAAKVKSRGVAM